MKPDTPLYLDPDAPCAARVDDLLYRMTLDEKISQMINEAPAIPRLGVPEYNWWNECLHGVARAGRATVFPQSIGMAASFDAPLMHEVATAISDEARAKHHAALRQDNRGIYFGLTYWTPNINIFRDPRWGRGQETYGEDPYLTARLGVAFVRGLQGDDPHYWKLVATPKHYAVHSGPETLRHTFDAVVSPRDLRETYLPAFRACVREAGAASVMGAYNRVNGEPSCASPTLLREILRSEWGFEGFVVSDCGAIEDLYKQHRVVATPAEAAALAVENGCELCCEWGGPGAYRALADAVQQGLISEGTVTEAVRRLLTARFRLGMFDPPERVPFSVIPPEVVGGDAHRALARRMARESLVLLKNEGGLLPLRKDARALAVVGPTAHLWSALVGNYFGLPSHAVTPLEGVLAAVSPGTQVLYAEGCRPAGSDRSGFDRALDAARAADTIIAVMGYTPEMEGEEGDTANSDGGGDRLHIGLPGVQSELLGLLLETGRPLVLVLTGGSPIALDGAEAAGAVLMAWYPGQEGGAALADVLFGDASPGGRLPVTFVKSLDQLPPFEDYAMAGRTYRFGTDAPAYPFGHGLSYTTFAYADLRLSAATLGANAPPDEALEVRVDVTNTGGRAGDEVVQLYVQDVEASVPVPRHHLEGFARVSLAPGETRTVTLALRAEQLMAFDDLGRPFLEPGEFRLSVGGGQPDDPAARSITALLTVRE